MARPVGVGPFAVGLIVTRKGQGWYVSHAGDNWGFKANLVAHVLKGYGVVVMANGDDGRRQLVVRCATAEPLGEGEAVYLSVEPRHCVLLEN